MFKNLSALFRGAVHDVAENVADANAVTILDQQIRDCTRALDAARRAVAFAQAQCEQEKTQHARILSRLEELETRAVAAIRSGKQELAREAASVIATLEAEKSTSEAAQSQFEREIFRLRVTVREAAERLAALKRGQKIAKATDRVQHLRDAAPGSAMSTLRDAESTLERLKVRQKQSALAADALAELDREGDPNAVIEKLAEAGCGTPLKPGVDAVLARLAGRAHGPQTAGASAN